MNSLVQRSFAAGEIAPALHARADLAKYQTGLKTCRNFFVRKEGGISTRGGLRFVGPCKTNTYGTRLVRYVGSLSGEGYLLEFGANYIRFYQDGAAIEVTGVPAYNGATAYSPGDVVSNGGVNYYNHTASTGVAPPNVANWHPLVGAILEIPTPWPLDELPEWNQSGNVITLTHPLHAPRELIFEEADRWVLRTIVTGAGIAAPAGLGGVAGGAGARVFKYVVTAAADDTFEESGPSAIATVSAAADPTTAAPIVLSWTAQPAAAEFYVYCDPYENGVFGYIGTATTNSFKHAGQASDFTLTPPIDRVIFSVTGRYPAVSANYQQRRFFANTFAEPDSIYGSRIGFTSNFGVSVPLQDDDAVTFRLAGNNHHAIRHMVAMGAGLILLTDGGEWTLTGGGGRKNPITPSSIDAEQETYVGILPWARPVVVGSSLLYVQARGNVLRELSFKQEVEGLAGRDLSIYASHLFERKQLYYVDYQQTPHSIVWCCDDEGRLLGLTYIPEQELWGWHRHDTDGAIEDVCVVPEDDQDVLYVIVRREIEGVDQRYIEKLELREFRDDFTHADMFLVDSGLSYSGAPALTFSGLEHLEGKTVAVIADGEALFNGTEANAPVVTGGAIELTGDEVSAGYSNVHVGLPYTPEIRTLALDVGGEEIRDHKKRVPSLSLLVHKSSRAFWAGPNEDLLRPYEPAGWETTGLVDDTLELNVPGLFDKHGSLLVRVVDPLPLTILGIIPRGEVGG